MSFLSPLMLLTLLVVPLLVLGYFGLLRRRRASVRALGTMQLTAAGSGRRMARRRHVPPAIFLAALSLLLVALARPAVDVSLPRREGTVILAFDVSNSMLADDLKPSRIDAAKAAASAFVKDQPSTVKIGVVAFSFGGLIVEQPTEDQEAVLAAIERLSPQGGTSLAEGIFTSLRAVSDEPIVLGEAAQEGDLESVDIGYFGSAVIVLLSDGENTSRFDPLIMAQLAANAGVRVHAIGIGSPDGTTVEVDGFRVATVLNEPLLEEVAAMTGGTYSRAEDEAELKDIYGKIDLKLTVKGEQNEVTGVLAVIAIVMLVAGGGLTMRWFGRVP